MNKKMAMAVFSGLKTTTLEYLGLLLPFITNPRLVMNKQVILRVDNLSCVFGWQKKGAKDNIWASILIRAFLESVVFVKHMTRMSIWEECLYDKLSRVSSTTKEVQNLVESFSKWSVPPYLVI